MTYAHVPSESRTGLWIGRVSANSPVAEGDMIAFSEPQEMGEVWQVLDLMSHPPIAPAATVADEAWSRLRAGLDDPALPAAIPPPRLDSPERYTEDAVEILRIKTGLPMTEIASILGVSRRTLYEWQHGAVPQSENRARTIQALQIIDTVTTVLSRDAAATWIRRQIRAAGGDVADLDVLGEAAENLGRYENLMRLEPVAAGAGGSPVSPLGQEEVRAILRRRAVPRSGPKRGQVWRPREIMPSVEDEEA